MAVYASFADEKGVREVFDMLCPGQNYSHPDLVGMGMTVDELIYGYVHGFAHEMLDPKSPHYNGKSLTDHVNTYLRYFDVKPDGGDVLKYICAFGYELERKVRAQGERELVCSLIRMNTLRMLRNVTAIRAGHRLPERMLQKIYKIWIDNKVVEMMGMYGTYMLFKTWTKLPAHMRPAPADIPSVAELKAEPLTGVDTESVCSPGTIVASAAQQASDQSASFKH